MLTLMLCSSTHSNRTSPLLDWKTRFVKLHTDRHTFERKTWQWHEYFFRRSPRSITLFLFQPLLGCIHSYFSPHFIWTGPWLDWKTLFVKLHTDTPFSAKFDNDLSIFFADNPNQQLFLLQHLLACIHSYSSPHFTWTSPWLELKTLFVKRHTDSLLSAKFDNVMSASFVDNPDQKFLLIQNLVWCLHSCSAPALIPFEQVLY